jgi:hypothetical protein
MFDYAVSGQVLLKFDALQGFQFGDIASKEKIYCDDVIDR